MCPSFTPPLSAAASAAAAAAAAGIAAAPSLARRRYLLGQVSSTPGGAGGAGEAAGTAVVAPPGGFPSGRGGSMCLLGRLPAARCGGSIPCPPLTSLPVYSCLGVKTRRPERPWDREWVGARHAVQVAGAHRLVRGAARCGFRRPGLRLGARGGLGREEVVLCGRACPSPPPCTRTPLVISPGLGGSCRRKPGLVRPAVPARDVWEQSAPALTLRWGERAEREEGDGPLRSARVPSQPLCNSDLEIHGIREGKGRGVAASVQLQISLLIQSSTAPSSLELRA